MIFPCSKCGACCRRASQWSLGTVPVRPDGSCEHLLADGSCGIYDKRPLICDVSRGYEELVADTGMSRREFFLLNNQICNEMIKADGLDPKFLIDLVAEYGESNELQKIQDADNEHRGGRIDDQDD